MVFDSLYYDHISGTSKQSVESFIVPCYLKGGDEVIGLITIKVLVEEGYTPTMTDIDFGFNDPNIFDCVEADVVTFLHNQYKKFSIEYRFP